MEACKIRLFRLEVGSLKRSDILWTPYRVMMIDSVKKWSTGMNVRQRFHNTMSFMNGTEAPDRLPMTEWASWWSMTLNRWYQEGLSKDSTEDELRDLFGHDAWRQFWIRSTCDGFPKMEHGQGPVSNTASYEAILPVLHPDDPMQHYRNSLMEIQPFHQKGEMLVWMTLEGFFWWPRVLFGIENHLYSFVDEPELLHRIINDQAEYCLRVIDDFCEILTPDFMTFAEDMSYNLGPMLSEDLFNTFLQPGYDKVIRKLKDKGIRVFVDSDGEVSKMIPWLLRVGIEGILPLERQAGCEVAELRRNYPNLLMIGAYDKMVMKNGEAAMRKEFERLLPTMKTGGFIPSVDHQTPPDVSLEQYYIYMKLYKEYSEKAVLV